MRACFRAGVATFQCSDSVVFVFVFAIPVCLDPCDPVDCGYSVPPCNSEPVWRNDLVSGMEMKQENPAVVSLTRWTLNRILDADVNILSFKGSKAKSTDSKFHPPTLLLFFIKLSCSPCWMCSCWSFSWKPPCFRFIVPISIVICNDIMAYLFGFFFGRTPLIKVSGLDYV